MHGVVGLTDQAIHVWPRDPSAVASRSPPSWRLQNQVATKYLGDRRLLIILPHGDCNAAWKRPGNDGLFDVVEGGLVLQGLSRTVGVSGVALAATASDGKHASTFAFLLLGVAIGSSGT